MFDVDVPHEVIAFEGVDVYRDAKAMCLIARLHLKNPLGCLGYFYASIQMVQLTQAAIKVKQEAPAPIR